MTNEQLIKAFNLCRDTISHISNESIRFNSNSTVEYRYDCDISYIIKHINFMCDEGIKLVNSNKIEKAMRWLGFVQGTLWCAGYTSIADLKSMNR